MLELEIIRATEGAPEPDIIPTGDGDLPLCELDRLAAEKYPHRLTLAQGRAVEELLTRELGLCETVSEIAYAWTFARPLLWMLTPENAKAFESLAHQRLASARSREFREAAPLRKVTPRGETYGAIDI
jgi:hypothetical protein